jgi:hypothetical protein
MGRVETPSTAAVNQPGNQISNLPSNGNANREEREMSHTHHARTDNGQNTPAEKDFAACPQDAWAFQKIQIKAVDGSSLNELNSRWGSTPLLRNSCRAFATDGDSPKGQFGLFLRANVFKRMKPRQ